MIKHCGGPAVVQRWSGGGASVVQCADGCRWCTDGGPAVVRWWVQIPFMNSISFEPNLEILCYTENKYDMNINAKNQNPSLFAYFKSRNTFMVLVFIFETPKFGDHIQKTLDSGIHIHRKTQKVGHGSNLFCKHYSTRLSDTPARSSSLSVDVTMSDQQCEGPPLQHSSSSSSSSSPRNGIDVFWDDCMLDHDTGAGVFDTGMDPGFLDVLEKHPENSDRIRNMLSILKRGPISPFISWHPSRPALVSELLSFHSREYIDSLLEANKNGGMEICSGTFLNPGSWKAALVAAGTAISAMKYIVDGNGKICYALVRPPGHHAQPTQADGYCFLNNAGLAVQYALDSGSKKVAVIDIDVHYGNGTAEGFYHSDKVLTISLHMNHGSWGPSHPQTGSINEVGEGAGYGYNLNIPLPNGTGDKGYTYAMTELVVPVITKFKPDIMVFVIGQDSSAFDPNGRQCLTMEGYREIGRIIRNLADDHSNGRILIVQEGGYHVTYSAYCLHATLEGVLNLPHNLLSDPIAYYPEDDSFAVKAIRLIKQHQTRILPLLRHDDNC
ncbi:hypothetical protein LXL04_014701 [Taraxacum kok-saghyz]